MKDHFKHIIFEIHVKIVYFQVSKTLPKFAKYKFKKSQLRNVCDTWVRQTLYKGSFWLRYKAKGPYNTMPSCLKYGKFNQLIN